MPLARPMKIAVVMALAACAVWLAARLERQGSLNEALVQAINHKDAKAVASLLRDGADPNTWAMPPDLDTPTNPTAIQFDITHIRNKTWQPPDVLFMASLTTAGATITKQLIDAGADPNGRSTYAQPIDAAARQGNSATVALLLSKGVRVDPLAVEFLTVGLADRRASAARRSGHAAIIAMFLSHGVDVDTRVGGNQTMLMAACAGGSDQCVRLLLNHHAKTALKDSQGHSAAWYATSNARIVKLLAATGPT